TVELAAAAALRLASDHVLAGGRNPGLVPDPLRRAWTLRSPLPFPPWAGRALGGHYSRGTGKIPGGPARTLRRRSVHRGEQGVGEWLRREQSLTGQTARPPAPFPSAPETPHISVGATAPPAP